MNRGAHYLRHCLLLLLFAASKLLAADYSPTPLQLRLTHERLTFKNGEAMGLLGVNLMSNTSDYSYAGFAGYGAVSGGRGGFFTIGYNMGLEVPLTTQLRGDAALFIGAGGGGSAPQGDGLMVRQQIGIDYLGERYRLGGGVSRVHFRRSDIDSTQPYLSLQLPFTMITMSGWADSPLDPGNESIPLYERPSSLSLSWKSYRGSGLQNATQSGATSMAVMGVEWRHAWKEHLYYSIASHGAYRGKAAGYAEATMGVGYQWPLLATTILGLEGDIGAGGGGSIGSGGGALGTVSLTLEQSLSKHLFLGLRGGYARSVNGNFSGRMLGVSLGSRWLSPSTSAWNDASPATQPYPARHYRLTLLQQHYYPADSILRTSPVARTNVDLLGVQLDHPITEYLYLSGQAMGAWNGQAGGYASGAIGGGIRLPVSNKVKLDLETLGGPAGGGGIDVGSGLLIGTTAGIRVLLGKEYDLRLATGRIRAVNGGLNARQLTIGLAYRFTLPQR